MIRMLDDNIDIICTEILHQYQYWHILDNIYTVASLCVIVKYVQMLIK